MELFKLFDENIKREVLYTPLNHPNIEYEWNEQKIQINDTEMNVIYFGSIIDDGDVDIVNINNSEIGFIDKNQNFITPILFHSFCLIKEEYQFLFEAINDLDEVKNLTKTTDNGLNPRIKDLIEFLDNDVTFYMDVLKYMRNGKFGFSPDTNVDEEDLDNLISFVEEKGESILKEYPHLKLMVNILVN